MGCYYELDYIRIPLGIRDQVEALIKKHDLDGPLTVEVFKGTTDPTELCCVAVPDGSMSYSTMNDIEEKFLPDLAALLKDTPFDGQVLETECEGQRGTLALVDGKVTGYDNSLPVIKHRGIAKGVEGTAVVKHKCLGLGNGKVLLLD